jgi:prepilin-type N-terminal cleavage/methylation domain-containing protein
VDRELHFRNNVGNRRGPSFAFTEGGFSMLEVLVAAAILAVALNALAQLLAVSTRANRSANTTTYATLLAQQKMEQLRSLLWGFDVYGLPLTDSTTDTTVVPETAAGGTGLSPSPADALLRNTTGYVEYLDRFGAVLGGDTTPAAGAVYIRRWSVQPLPTDPANTVVLQVMVTRNRNHSSGMADAVKGGSRLPDEVFLVSVKTRKKA